MNPQTEYVTLSVSDGSSMRAYVARPEGQPKGGLMVFQEAFGVNPHIRDVTERFARQGYLAVAPELFHRAAPGFEGRYDDFPTAMEYLRQLTPAGIEADVRAAFDWLQSNGPVKPFPTGAIGYCMGGRVACHAALTVPVACGISYYGGGIAPGLLDRLKDLRAPMLFFWGGLDHHITSENVQAVTAALHAANKDFVSVEFSQADHGFFCDARASYNAAAAAQAWSLTLAYLDQNVTGQSRGTGA
jgi:carboxymethylenebutenolidase